MASEIGELKISRCWDGDDLEWVVMRFSGELAKIPSLKNAKIPGTNFTNPKIMHRIKAMDAAYFRSECNAKRTLTFGATTVFVLLVLGKRAVMFDADNCFATVKDWLEPQTKPVGKGRARGWGIGLVKNDNQICGMALRASDLGLKTADSFIVINRWDSDHGVAEAINTMLKDIVRV